MEQLEKALDDYIELNGITFELRAVNSDGEVILQESSSLGFDDVAAFSELLDERFTTLVTEEVNNQNDQDETDREY